MAKKAEYSAKELLEVLEVSRATLERYITAGWCPPPTRTAQLHRGGSPARFWNADVVAALVQAVKRSKRTGEALATIMERERTNARPAVRRTVRRT